jgi:hypothetical protein
MIVLIKKLIQYISKKDKKILIIQPGRMGDLLICMPIAHHYHQQGYKVYWPILSEYTSVFRNIDYVETIPILNKDVSDVIPYIYNIKSDYPQILDLSFGFEHSALNKSWDKISKNEKSFIEYKYSIAKIELSKRWCLKWNRNKEFENKLFDSLQINKPYALVHSETHNFRMNMDININQVHFQKVDDFNIFDWYLVIINAEEIHCIDSSLANFIEVIHEAKEIRKTMYLSHRTQLKSNHSIYQNNWIIK